MPEERAARDAWFHRLELEGKDDTLFELEVLLKAAACFANPRNHTGAARRANRVALDFKPAATAFRDGIERAISLCQQLLGVRDRAFTFHRYLETVLPEDSARHRLLREADAQSGPEESLMMLRHAFTSTLEVVEGVLRAPRVPFRTFYAVLSLVQREVGRNVYFNPLTALEFRPEFDRIKSAQVLELIRAVPGDETHRLVALTFLSLFRMLRYLKLLERIAAEGGPRRGRSVGPGHLVLSVLRSDARALSTHVSGQAGARLAASFTRDVLDVPASRIRERAPSLRAAGHRLVGVRSALEGVAGNLRLEMRRAFEHDLPPLEGRGSDAQFRIAVANVVRNLRPALQNSVLFLGRSLGARLDEGGVFDDQAARRETSDRLRRDVWMFAQIVRAFSTKAQHSSAEDTWTAVYSFQYVREFLAYFRSMGYPLLRATDYPRFDAFISAMARLQDTDLVDPQRLEDAIDECVAFHGFLLQLFDDISSREELSGVPFDRRAAALALRLYLGD